MSVRGQIEKLGRLNWESPLEKFPGYSGINSEISDLAAVISNKFSRADLQNLTTRVNFRPEADTGN
jgi:hypothetical protein